MSDGEEKSAFLTAAGLACFGFVIQLVIYAAIFVIVTKLAFGWWGGF